MLSSAGLPVQTCLVPGRRSCTVRSVRQADLQYCIGAGESLPVLILHPCLRMGSKPPDGIMHATLHMHINTYMHAREKHTFASCTCMDGLLDHASMSMCMNLNMYLYCIHGTVRSALVTISRARRIVSALKTSRQHKPCKCSWAHDSTVQHMHTVVVRCILGVAVRCCNLLFS